MGNRRDRQNDRPGTAGRREMPTREENPGQPRKGYCRHENWMLYFRQFGTWRGSRSRKEAYGTSAGQAVFATLVG